MRFAGVVVALIGGICIAVTVARIMMGTGDPSSPAAMQRIVGGLCLGILLIVVGLKWASAKPK
jgi:formate/nitrite transporter FocA (FNT family)